MREIKCLNAVKAVDRYLRSVSDEHTRCVSKEPFTERPRAKVIHNHVFKAFTCEKLHDALIHAFLFEWLSSLMPVPPHARALFS